MPSVELHPSLRPTAFGRLIGKHKLLPLDLSDPSSFENRGDILDEPATQPGQKTIVVECEEKLGRTYSERVFKVERADGGDVKVGDVLRAVHKFLYEALPLFEWNILVDPLRRAEIEAAYQSRKARRGRKGKSKAIVDDDGLSDDNGEKTKDRLGTAVRLRKIDWLLGRTVFNGLVRETHNDFKWYLKLSRPSV